MKSQHFLLFSIFQFLPPIIHLLVSLFALQVLVVIFNFFTFIIKRGYFILKYQSGQSLGFVSHEICYSVNVLIVHKLPKEVFSLYDFRCPCTSLLVVHISDSLLHHLNQLYLHHFFQDDRSPEAIFQSIREYSSLFIWYWLLAPQLEWLPQVHEQLN